MPIGTYVSIITLNVKRLNAPTKRYRLNGYKNKIYIFADCKRPTLDLETHTDWVKGWKKIFHVNGNQKKARLAILISDKIDFKISNIVRDKERQYIIIKGSIQEDDITSVNMYVPNIGAP